MLSFSSRASIRQLLQFMLPDIFPSAFVAPFFGDTAPSGWLFCDGTEFAISTHQNLFLEMVHNISFIGPGTKEGDFTANPATDELSLGGHSFVNGQIVHVNTDGTLPAPLTKDTTLFVRDVGAGIFKLAFTLGGGAIDITSSGSGTHSVFPNFQTPDTRGRTLVGVDNLGGASANRMTNTQADEFGGSQGSEVHTLVDAEVPVHAHLLSGVFLGIGSGSTFGLQQNNFFDSQAPIGMNSVGGGGTHNNVQPTLFCGWIIKT